MKVTTQNAPLEKLLSYFRYKRTIKFIKIKKFWILDVELVIGMKNLSENIQNLSRS